MVATHRVTAALVTAITRTGVRHFYCGDVLPADVTDASLANLRSLGFIETEGDEAVEVESGAQPLERPNEAGPGSAIEKWLAYAAEHGIELEPDASKADVIAAVAAAGK